MNVLPFDIEWAPGGVMVGGHRTHVHYVDRMCKQALDHMKRHLEKNLESVNNVTDRMNLYAELSHHISVCHER